MSQFFQFPELRIQRDSWPNEPRIGPQLGAKSLRQDESAHKGERGPHDQVDYPKPFVVFAQFVSLVPGYIEVGFRFERFGMPKCRMGLRRVATLPMTSRCAWISRSRQRPLSAGKGASGNGVCRRVSPNGRVLRSPRHPECLHGR